MSYYYKATSTAYSDSPSAPDYTTSNAILVDYVSALLASPVPTTVISHTSGTTSTSEDYLIQIGNSEHYYHTSIEITDIQTIDSADGTGFKNEIYDFTGLSAVVSDYYWFGSSVHNTPAAAAPIYQLFSANLFVYGATSYHYTGSTGSTHNLAWFKGQTGNWYAMEWTTSGTNVYRNGDNTNLSTNLFLMPLQSTSYFFLTPISMYENDQLFDIAIPQIGAYNANQTYLANPSINQYGSNYYFWNQGFAATDAV